MYILLIKYFFSKLCLGFNIIKMENETLQIETKNIDINIKNTKSNDKIYYTIKIILFLQIIICLVIIIYFNSIFQLFKKSKTDLSNDININRINENN